MSSIQETPLRRVYNTQTVKFCKLNVADFLKLCPKLIPAVYDTHSQKLIFLAKENSPAENNELSDDILFGQ